MSCAAILTGGRARRFGGVDKAALLVDGRSILDRQIAALAGISAISKIFLVGGAGHHAAAESIADTIADSGPLAGIHSALMAARAAGDDHVFVLACDMPDVSTAFIAYLLSRAREADAIVPRTARGFHPLCAVYADTCLGAIERRLAERQLAVTKLLDDVRVRVVEGCELDRYGDAHQLLRNVNTPDEYAALRIRPQSSHQL